MKKIPIKKQLQRCYRQSRQAVANCFDKIPFESISIKQIPECAEKAELFSNETPIQTTRLNLAIEELALALYLKQDLNYVEVKRIYHKYFRNVKTTLTS